MSTVRLLSNKCKQHSSIHQQCRSFARQARTSKKSGDQSSKKRKSGLLNMAERCKDLLHLNWRGQLTTIRPRLADKKEREKAEKTLGDFANYIMFNGDMIVHIPEESKHCPNLLLNNHASMIVGHTDPAPLMKVFQQIGQRPPHALLVGRLMVPEKADMLSAEFLKVLIEKDLTDLQEAVNQSSTSIRPILESGSHILRSHVQTLTSILESKKDDTFYRLDASSCYYVDMSGVKHLAEPERLQQAKISFSPLLQVVIEGINRNQSRRMGLKLICACFLRVKVKEAFVSSGDRLGLNILARVLSDPDRPVSVSSIRKKEDSEKAANEVFEWKDLRLSFKTEVNDVNEFCAMLSQMEKECINALNCAREGMSHLSTSLKMCEKQVA